jgi:hypothetical protein
MENVDEGNNRTDRFLDERFEKFRLVSGLFLPFKATRELRLPGVVNLPTIQTIIVKEAKVNDDAHEELLNGFDFPEGASISTDSWLLRLRVLFGEYRVIVFGLSVLGFWGS